MDKAYANLSSIMISEELLPGPPHRFANWVTEDCRLESLSTLPLRFHGFARRLANSASSSGSEGVEGLPDFIPR